MSATVTIPYEQMKTMEAAIARLTEEGDRIARQLAEARLDGKGDGHGRAYRDALLALFPAVQFAIANMNPMTFRGWPHDALTKFADLLDGLPMLPVEIGELKMDLRIFAKDCKKWEDARAAGTEQQLLIEENERHRPPQDPVGPRAMMQREQLGPR